MIEPQTIQKVPVLDPAEDYAALRKEGIDLLQQLAGALWTDYNIHDPGVTLLELLCFAETEIGFKLGFSIQDLLAPRPGESYDTDLQAFFTARRILTCNPWTTGDFRKLLIDLIGVRNAWLHCRNCGCGITLYANCAESVLQYGKTEHPFHIRGFDDVRIELESDPVNGDLNSGKIFSALAFTVGTRLAKATVETRFPPWHDAANAIMPLADLLKPESGIVAVTVNALSAIKGQAVDVPASDMYRALRQPLFAFMDIQFRSAPAQPLQSFTLTNVPVRVWYRSDDDRKAIDLAMLKDLLSDSTSGGVAARYLAQLKQAADVVASATASLHAHRNLAEDYCTISTVPVQDVALCADIAMAADADIEEVLGEAYWQIGNYFNPVVPIHSLREMLDMDVVTEEIFNGPQLEHGFIRNEDLDAAELRTKLYSSDIINILMDIEGILSVSNLTLARYNADGRLVESQPWELAVTPGHLPRLYIHASKVLVYKNELPFLPDADELNDALQLQMGLGGQQKFDQAQNDFPVPRGSHVDNASMLALQESLPDTYGVGRHGLAEPASDARKGKTRQLKAYLLVFEHLLSVYLQQLHHFRDLLSTDAAITRTYFPAVFTEETVRGVTELYDGVTESDLLSLLETPASFTERRNAFLDHLLARFAESFSDYALMLYTAYGSEQKAGEQLITDKIHFLQSFEFMSRNRGRSLNYRDPAGVCVSGNISGLEQRIRVLLGIPDAGSGGEGKVFVVEHILLRPRNLPSPAFPDGDPLLPVCIPPDCAQCGEDDPYSYRLTIVLNGEEGLANQGIRFRRFAERTIRQEVPAHLAVKICWVSAEQLAAFETVYCAWLQELNKEQPKALPLHQKLVALLKEFAALKSVYPSATLHDCVDGDDENRIYLNSTSI